MALNRRTGVPPEVRPDPGPTTQSQQPLGTNALARSSERKAEAGMTRALPVGTSLPNRIPARWPEASSTGPPLMPWLALPERRSTLHGSPISAPGRDPTTLIWSMTRPGSGWPPREWGYPPNKTVLPTGGSVGARAMLGKPLSGADTVATSPAVATAHVGLAVVG